MRLNTAYRPLLGLLIAATAVLAPQGSAIAAVTEVLLKDGTVHRAERVHYTYTHLVILTADNDLKVVPNDSVKSVDGVPFMRAYWEDRPGQGSAAGQGDASAAAPVVIDRLMPLKPGTFRRYDTEQVRTTWLRRGRNMERRDTTEVIGSVRENVTGMNEGSSAVNVLEIINERPRKGAARTVTLKHQLEGREDGYYLVGQSMEDKNLSPAIQSDTIAEPPRLWPQKLAVGQSWIVGPFRRLGLGQVLKMQVESVESITLPIGTYREAYRVVGRGNVFGGSQQLTTGRLVTDHGTLETTTWVVPGIGPVRELTKVHLHQDFFPNGSKGGEIPLVVEEEGTRTLAEFHAGQ